jgi:hypothetical protein
MDNNKVEDRIPLSNPQTKVFFGFAMQREEIQRLFQEVIDAEKEYIALLVKNFGLEGESFVVRKGDKNELYLQKDTPK